VGQLLRQGSVLWIVCIFIGTFAAISAVAPPADTTPPVASAGPDQTVNEDAPTTFDGSGSSDNVGVVNYTWTFPRPAPSGPPEILYPGPGGNAVLDPVRPYVYGALNDRVVFVNLTSKAVEQTFPLSHVPQAPLSIAISPAGTYLAVGIPVRPHDYYWFDPHEGYLASFDLVSRTRLGEFHINEDPFDILVTSDGYALVAGGSGQWTYVRMYDAKTGTETGSPGGIRQMSYIGLHPSERRLYSVETDLYPPHLNRLDFVPGVGFSGGWTWPYHGDYIPGSDVWATSRGDRLITQSGLLLTSSDNVSGDMQIVQRLASGPISAVASDDGLGLLAVGTGAVQYFDLNTSAFIGSSYGLGGTTTDLVFRGSHLYAYNGSVVVVPLPTATLYGVAPTYTFETPDTYVVMLTVRDAAGNSAPDNVTITVRDVTSPAANAGPDQTVLKGTVVTLVAFASSDNVGIVRYNWSFVDGGAQTLEGAYVSYRFSNAGTFVVTLSVTDAANNVGNDTMIVTVYADATPPLADAGPDRVVYKGGTMAFDASRSTDNIGIASYTWTFTDGSLQTLQGIRPSYRFSNTGTYMVLLTVTDMESNAATDTLSVSVRDFPLAEYDRPAGFRIAMPSSWNISVDTYYPGVGPVDLSASDPAGGGATILVWSRAAAVQDTDDFLLTTARNAMTNLRYQYGFSIVVTRAPEIMGTANTRAAIFEVNLTGAHVQQIWAVFVNARYGRIMYVVGSSDSDVIEAYRPVFEAVIQSPQLVPPPDPVRTMVVVLVAFLGLTIGPIVGIMLWLNYRRRKSPYARPTRGTAPGTVGVEPRLTSPAPTPVPSAQTSIRPRFCPRCGSPSVPPGNFCGRCGSKLR